MQSRIWRFVAAIEKLIRKRIDRVIVPGYEPDPGTLSSLIGKDAAARETRRPQDTSRSITPVPKERARSKPADPIFSQPYEPGYASIAQRPAPPAAARRRERPVAALLGGLKSAKT